MKSPLSIHGQRTSSLRRWLIRVTSMRWKRADFSIRFGRVKNRQGEKGDKEPRLVGPSSNRCPFVEREQSHRRAVHGWAKILEWLARQTRGSRCVVSVPTQPTLFFWVPKLFADAAGT